ncbi:heterogeneous nuclear ribonucleoprotein H isoform X1 [Anoplophora glabripennis]|uniref:Heterogeneous nuclear ribonucleoprotein H n=1 Tax=Anoplophora glabripennis TaxID=217634 RepID=V5G959_ANOGL|nr:heterogeneous nuclear ribonucleoprotein H isoform X1 [Anoplophora glabripennis]
MSGGGDSEEGNIVKLRGLPWSATTDDIQKFFRDCKILGGKFGVHMTSSREGRPSGEAFVEFEDAEDVEIAIQKDREHIGNRYIEVFKVNRAEMEWVIKRSGPTYGSNEDGCVRLRGLPFGCSKEEIAQFFTGLEIVPNGITLLTDYSGRSSGEAYVQFVNREVAEKALQKHREKIGHRYIEIFRSSLSEVNSVLGYQGRRGGSGSGMYNSRPGPYDRDRDRYGSSGRFQSRGSRSFKGANFSNNGSDYNSYDRPSPWLSNSRNGSEIGGPRSPYMDSWGGGSERSAGMHCVHMRGLPFKATQSDILDFFKPVIPVNVRLLQDHTGRASGEADVEFASHDDAVRAMSKDKGHMQHRYIELFLNSAGSSSNGSSGYGPGRRRL